MRLFSTFLFLPTLNGICMLLMGFSEFECWDWMINSWSVYLTVTEVTVQTNQKEKGLILMHIPSQEYCQSVILPVRIFTSQEYCQLGTLPVRNITSQDYYQSGIFTVRNIASQDYYQSGILPFRNIASQEY